VLIIVSTKRKEKKRRHGFWSLACWQPNSLEPGLNKAFLKNVMFLCLLNVIIYLLLLHIL
jgi:hypothetical protein